MRPGTKRDPEVSRWVLPTISPGRPSTECSRGGRNGPRAARRCGGSEQSLSPVSRQRPSPARRGPARRGPATNSGQVHRALAAESAPTLDEVGRPGKQRVAGRECARVWRPVQHGDRVCEVTASVSVAQGGRASEAPDDIACCDPPVVVHRRELGWLGTLRHGVDGLGAVRCSVVGPVPFGGSIWPLTLRRVERDDVTGVPTGSAAGVPTGMSPGSSTAVCRRWCASVITGDTLGSTFADAIGVPPCIKPGDALGV